jgi:hypothetical protein
VGIENESRGGTEGDGNTPLDEDEAAGLIPTHITTQGELNEFEQANIVEGDRQFIAELERLRNEP